MIKYIDKLQRQNADDLAFYPLASLEKALAQQKILMCYENNEPAGYLWFGSIRASNDTTIYQACVDYDSRRRHLAMGMVTELFRLCRASSSTGIRLKCASSSDANEFWIAAGFYCTAILPGGRKRRRDLNCFRADIEPQLWTPEAVTPSAKKSDTRLYVAEKRQGVVMASRFSRTHYIDHNEAERDALRVITGADRRE